ncbi:RnfH family protein [Polaromonas jejuensis]|uniref:UPF0125 protein ACFPP7_18085 n=1 Tax=Polaromonas jejuensis TaxID=457502 RepID=A0ABW0QF82_9BURK
MLLKISLVYSPAPRQVREWVLEVAAGTSIAQTLAQCRIFEEFPELQIGRLSVGVWGRKTTPGHLLHDKDRVEIYRGLRVDPKVARRERFNRQGVKRAGLFAKRRDGGKAGY